MNWECEYIADEMINMFCVFPTPALSGSGYDGRSIPDSLSACKQAPIFYVCVRIIICYEAQSVILFYAHVMKDVNVSFMDGEA